MLFLKHQYERYGDKVDIAEFVREGMIISGLFNQLGVIDENGIYIQATCPTKRMDLSDQEHFRVHRGGQRAALREQAGARAGLGQVVDQMTRRINKPDGALAVVVISVDPVLFLDFPGGCRLAVAAWWPLVGADGIVRARRAGESQNRWGRPVVRQLMEADSAHWRLPFGESCRRRPSVTAATTLKGIPAHRGRGGRGDGGAGALRGPAPGLA